MSRADEHVTWKQRLAYRTYRAGEWLAAALPEPVGRRVFATLGRLAHRVLPNVRATVRANQARVHGFANDDPRLELATREAFDLYARYWIDTFRLPTLPHEAVNARTRFVGAENIDRALELGKGVICVIPHMGNWDVAGAWLGINGYPIWAVAEVLEPRPLFELFRRNREAMGMKIVALEKDGHVGTQLKRLLSENQLIALVSDRDLTGRGVEVEMFGAPRKVPAGPALLSITSGAPLLMCSSYTLDDGYEVRIGAPIEAERTGELRRDVEALSRAMADGFERAIAARPTDWHLFQPGWDDGSSAARPTPRASTQADGSRPA